MCGIAGFFTSKPSADSIPILNRMADSIRHRGPDDFGVYSDPYCSLGHRRLSIVDLSTGHQPMSNETGQIRVVFNGEIYNHADLRPELEAAGHRYQSRSDTETILHAYEQFGPDCVTRFRGMFAFAIWDQPARTLFLARDRLGIKPLYYFFDGTVFVFASEIKALLMHPRISPRLEESLLPEYLSFGYISEERTLFAGIRKLMPGHTMRISLDDFTPRIDCYWQLPARVTGESRTDAEWTQATRSNLEESVRLRLMSDVPLGVFLSGGLDSSAIAAIMQGMVSEPVKTFSVGYSEAQYSELSYARAVAKLLGTDHQEIVVSKSDFFARLPSLVWHEDEPITWPSSVSLHFVSELAAQRVKVVLTGEGSDELFGGYGRYRYQLLNQRWLKIYQLLPNGARRMIRENIESSSLLSGSLRRKLNHTVLGRTGNIESLYLENFYGAFSQKELAGLFHLSGDPFASYLAAWNAAPNLPPLERMLYADKRTYLIELLMKQDRMSMSASIESRVPFLDHVFVEFASQIPARLKITKGSAKHILKESVSDLLPASIVHRKKMGFPTPLRQWLMEPDSAPLYDFLQDSDGLLAEYIERDRLAALLTRHRSGAEDATNRIWNLLNLQLWGDIFLRGNRERWSGGLLTPSRMPASV